MKKEKELKPNVYRAMRIDGKKKKCHIDVVDVLTATGRGTNGFGSTGR